MSLREQIRGWNRRKTAFVLVTLLLTALIVGGMAVAIDATLFETDDDSEGLPHASFQYEEGNVTVPNDSDDEWRAIEISHDGGHAVDQGDVIVTVDGERAWDVREDENGTVQFVEPWSGEGTVEESGTRIVAHGESLDDVPVEETREEPGDGEERDDGSDEQAEETEETKTYRTLEEGDVVEVTWYSDDGDRMTVLQRHVVKGDEADEEDGEDDEETSFLPPE